MKYLKYFENYSNIIVIGDKIITQKELNLILKGYLECALWTDEEYLKTEKEMPKIDIDFNEDDTEDEMDDFEKMHKMPQQNFTIEDIDINSLISTYNDIKEFIEYAGSEAVNYAISENGYERLGHDIWLTRNGHGAGFFDHSYDDDIEQKLINAGKKLPEIHLYLTENKIIFE